MRNLLYAAIGLAAASLAPTAARAGVIVIVDVNGSGPTTLCSSATNSCAQASDLVVGGVTISGASVASNAPGSPLLSFSSGSSTIISNLSGALATVSFFIGGNGYTQPLPPATLFSRIGGTVTIGGGANAVTMVSCTVSGPVDTSCSGGTTTAPLTPNITATDSTYQAQDTTPVTSLTAPYSLVEGINYTLSDGAILGFQASTSLRAVPEPVSLALLGVGLLGLGAVPRRKHSV
jgi:uncharacterized membrane protein (Fun14 family)